MSLAGETAGTEYVSQAEAWLFNTQQDDDNTQVGASEVRRDGTETMHVMALAGTESSVSHVEHFPQSVI